MRGARGASPARVHNLIAMLMGETTSERESSVALWPLLLATAFVLIVILYLLYRSKPPSGPKIGE